MAFVGVALAAMAALAPPPFFDTVGRLQRTASPPRGVSDCYVPVFRGDVLLDAAPESTAPVTLSAADAAQWLDDEDCVAAWLGSADEGPLAALSPGAAPAGFWLLELSHLTAPPVIGGARWAPFRTSSSAEPSSAAPVIDRGGIRGAISDDEAALLATARGLAAWHRSVKFCSSCGSPTLPARHGRNRQCVDAACGARFRPRLDPSVIMLVTRGDECLLGRKGSWAVGRYSTLAGFVEFGETLEECVVRESYEECGVRVDRATIRPVGSAPWLFPRSLMCGYIAEVEAPATDGGSGLDVDEDELADARWFSRSFVKEQLALQGEERDEPPMPGGFHVPGRFSLARTIIKQWAAEG